MNRGKLVKVGLVKDISEEDYLNMRVRVEAIEVYWKIILKKLLNCRI